MFSSRFFFADFLRATSPLHAVASAFGLVVLISLLAAGCGRSHRGSLAEIRARGELVVGVFGDKPPFGYIDPDGANAGYDVALARELGWALLGDSRKVRFVTVEAANCVAFLQANRVDLILANFTRTPERTQAVDFAEPYLRAARGRHADVIAPAVKPGNRELRDWLNREIIRLRQSGFFRSAYDRELRRHLADSVNNSTDTLIGDNL